MSARAGGRLAGTITGPDGCAATGAGDSGLGAGAATGSGGGRGTARAGRRRRAAGRWLVGRGPLDAGFGVWGGRLGRLVGIRCVEARRRPRDRPLVFGGRPDGLDARDARLARRFLAVGPVDGRLGVRGRRLVLGRPRLVVGDRRGRVVGRLRVAAPERLGGRVEVGDEAGRIARGLVRRRGRGLLAREPLELRGRGALGFERGAQLGDRGALGVRGRLRPRRPALGVGESGSHGRVVGLERGPDGRMVGIEGARAIAALELGLERARIAARSRSSSASKPVCPRARSRSSSSSSVERATVSTRSRASAAARPASVVWMRASAAASAVSRASTRARSASASPRAASAAVRVCS